MRRDFSCAALQVGLIILASREEQLFDAIDREILVVLQLRAGPLVKARDEWQLAQVKKQRAVLRLIKRRLLNRVIFCGRLVALDISLTNPGPIENRADQQNRLVPLLQTP